MCIFFFSHLQCVSTQKIQTLTPLNDNNTEHVLEKGAKAAWVGLLALGGSGGNGGSNGRSGGVTLQHISKVLKMLHVQELIHRRTNTTNSSTNSSTISSADVGTPRGGASVDVLNELRYLFNPSLLHTHTQTTAATNRGSTRSSRSESKYNLKQNQHVLTYPTMCTFAQLGADVSSPIVDLFVARSRRDEANIATQIGWFRAGKVESISE